MMQKRMIKLQEWKKLLTMMDNMTRNTGVQGTARGFQSHRSEIAGVTAAMDLSYNNQLYSFYFWLHCIESHRSVLV